MAASPQSSAPAAPAPSFLRYVEARKAARAARQREGALYAYGPDLRFRLTVTRLRPVALAVEAAARELRGPAWSRLLEGAVPLSEHAFPALNAQLLCCAERLGLPAPRAFVTATPALRDVTVLGEARAPAVLLPASLLDGLDEPARLATLGHACGRVHNEHAPLLTALYFLEHAALPALRWAARPAALALGAWAASAAITADRASLLCARDLATATRALALRAGALGLPADAPLVRARAAALALFARTAFYRGGQAADAQGGPALTLGECEARTRALLAGGAPARAGDEHDDRNDDDGDDGPGAEQGR